MRYVALFRGINVGKAKRIAMADLRTLLGRMGFKDVATLLNSGNAVFTSAAGTPADLAARIRAEVAKKLAVDALVVVKSAADIAAIIKGNALVKANALADAASDASRLLIAMVQDAKSLAAQKEFASQDWGNERLHVNRHAAYIWCADGILESKLLPAFLSGLGPGATSRNWATLNRIHALMGPDA